MDTREVLLTSCRNNKQWSACVWDYTIKNAFHHFKNGGTLAPRSANFVGTDYFIAADNDKPLIHVWLLNSQEPMQKRQIMTPNKVSALAICPQSCYLAAAIQNNLYIWHLSSGKLLTIQSCNFQNIMCMQFSSDSCFLVLTGQDGMLVVYKLVNLISRHYNYRAEDEIGHVEPAYTKCDHSMAITDIHIGSFGGKSRLVTVSGDRTCHVYALLTGELLLTLVFPEALSAVTFDGSCWNLYVGDISGRIQHFSLRNAPEGNKHHVDNNDTFVGHQKRITCLDLNAESTVLASGSDDGSVIMWNLGNRQMMKTIDHRGEVTNVKFLFNLENFVQTVKPKLIITNLERTYTHSTDFVVRKMQDRDIHMSDSDDDEIMINCRTKQLQVDNMRLRAVNEQLYNTAQEISAKYSQR